MRGSAPRMEPRFPVWDWVDPFAPPDRPGESRTDPYLVATAYFARSAEVLGLAAGVLGRDEEQARYQALAAEVRAAFLRGFAPPVAAWSARA